MTLNDTNLLDIFDRTFRSLEWERLKGYLSEHADSAAGKKECMNLALADEKAQVQHLLGETWEALSLLRGRSGLQASGLPDMRDILPRIEIAASLSGSELNAVRSTLLYGRQFRQSLSLLEAEAFPRLTEYAPRLPVAEKVIDAIGSTVDEAGQILDDASSLLRQLRREVQKLEAAIKETLLKIIHSSSLSKALVEPLYTQRNGRYVLPVNSSMRTTIPGIVHDSSASGLTVYVEPIAVLELANKVRIKETEIEREIARILEELSRLAAGFYNEIALSFKTLTELDVIMARARLANKYEGICPELSDDRHFEFRRARHPLLILQNASQSVIPNDIKLGGDDSRTLVITGPNTGGKTVLLKLIGLYSLMIRAGLLIPAQEGSIAAFYTNVCADIGDEQSLEQSLSTFSSHMKNIVDIIDKSGDGWLILLDEVGAGTDPREGAALARAILEHLNSSGAVTIATTHYGELKTLAYTERGFVNGSLDFDEETLSPTYKLRLGVPGSSKATTIAKRLGLDARVIARACELVEVQDIDMQNVIKQLEMRIRDAQQREEAAQQALNETKVLQELAAQTIEQAQRDLESAKIRQASDVEHEYQLGKDYIKHLIADLQKQPSISKAQKVQNDLERVRAELGWTETKSKKSERSTPEIVLGQNVRVLSLNQRGIVIEVPQDLANNAASLVGVRCGAMKIRVPAADLEIVGREKRAEDSTRAGSHFKAQRGATRGDRFDRSSGGARNLPSSVSASRDLDVFVRTSANTLDLRGKRVDDALADLERFMDESSVSSTSPVMIIHGHGTGAVRQAVRDYLGSNYAKSFKSGEHYEGGDGVTIVQL